MKILLLLVASSAISAERPNILFLLSDDQAWAGLSCQMHPDLPESRHPFAETPSIANLAEQGMRFSAAYAPAPVCSPTRISLQTGQNPAALGWTKAAPLETGRRLIEGATRKIIQADETTLAELLKTATLIEKYRKLAGGGNDKEVGRTAISEDLDRGVGGLVVSLDELGLADSTYVIYMSDNGGSNRRTLMGGKGDVWEGGIRVPLIVRGPGVAANSWCHQRVVGYDWFPTFCGWAGVKESLPANLDGGSLAHLLGGSNELVKRPREPLVFHFPHYQGDTPHSAILSGQHKLIRFYETGENQLFDLHADLAERHNLAAKQPELASKLAKQLADYLQEVGAEMPKPNPDYDPAKEPAKKGSGKGGKKGAKKR